MPEIIEIECPFCNQKIKVLHREETFRMERARAASNTKIIPKRIAEKYEILVEKCPNCGKSKKEIEKALKEGKQPSHDEVIRRLREAGLDPTKLK
jgi:sarcosine oxidase delta subunit